MKKILLLLFHLLFLVYYGQNDPRDALQKELKTAKDDTGKADLLIQLGDNSEGNELLRYTMQALELSEKTGYKKGIAKSLNNLGYYYGIERNDNEKAIACFDKAITIAKEVGDDRTLMSILNNKGLVCFGMGFTEKALDCFLQSLATAEKLHDKTEIARNLNSLGTVYEQKKMYPEALRSFLQALEIMENIGDEEAIPALLANTGNIYAQLKQYQKAREYTVRSIGLSRKTGNKHDLAHGFGELGTIYYLTDSTDKAMEQFMTSLRIHEELGDSISIAYNYINIGFGYHTLNKVDSAIIYSEKALELGQKLNIPEVVRDAYKNLSKIYERTRQFEKAFIMHSRFKIMSDSIYNIQVRESVVKKQMQYDFDKKEEALKIGHEKEITKAAYEKKILTIFISGLAVLFILALVVGLLIFRQNRLRAAQRTMQLEQKLLRTQMNPHFIYNCLQAIQNYIRDHQAEKYLSSFGTLTRAVLETSGLERIPLYKEIELLEHYLQLQKLLHQNQFDYTIRIAPDLEVDALSLPPMLSQPFIENAIEHGFRYIESGGLIEVSFCADDKNLYLGITDNGRGIQNEANKEHRSMATQITRERIQLLNRSNKSKAGFTISEADPAAANKGVKVCFTIPLQ
ncbi:MAG: hypothetical protein K0S33_3794 [Bacteroidetes bacterium]|jgi:tetratricopeptide (TPR) repeat protein|nr:hypothetical protein [Bacteroidota bacterium]